MMAVIQDFLSGFFLWRDAVLAAVLVSIICGWLGVYVILKRIVFVSAALPQVSGLGIALSFYLGSFIGPHGHGEFFLFHPIVMALLCSFIAAALLSMNVEYKKLGRESLIG